MAHPNGWTVRKAQGHLKAGAGEEAEQGPFAELGEHGAGFDVCSSGEFVAAPVAWWLAGDDGGDQLAAGRPAAGRQGGGPAVGTALAGGARVVEGGVQMVTLISVMVVTVWGGGRRG